MQHQISPGAPFQHQISPGVPFQHQISPGNLHDQQLLNHIQRKDSQRDSQGSLQLSAEQVKALRSFHKEKCEQYTGVDGDLDLHHGHHEKHASIITAVISGVINWLLMFGLCCAYGMILFSDEWHLRHRTLGVKMNLFTAGICGLILAVMSKIPVAIGGPDLNPVVFLAGFVETLGKSIAGQLELEYPGGSQRRLDSWNSLYHDSRGLGSKPSANVEFCDGNHLQDNMAACASYHEQLLATVMFATAMSSALLGLIFFCLGRFKLTRFVAYVPTSIMEAFLACVGYKVFKYALKFSNFEPRQFMPAAVCGVTLYFVKAMHIGNPAVMIPLMLFVPLGVFYGIVFGGGSDLNQARKDGLLFPELDDINFWTVWTEGFGNMGNINREAYLETLPDLVVMVVVCLLDCLLKLASTENKLKMNVEKDYEVSLIGASNILTTCSFSSVGYMQLKFNVINYGVMGNLVDRRGGITYAILCAAGFFGTVQYFNFMPRFFLSLLLFFAGSGFIAENLWGSRQYLRPMEWLQICVILFVFILSEKLLFAVAAGILLTCIRFVSTCAQVPCILGANLRGGDLATSERHERVLQRNLEHITNSWLMVIRLKGYVFFGSATSLVALVRAKIREQEKLPEFQRLHFIIFDCKMLDGMDASASRRIRLLEEEAVAAHIRYLWSHVDQARAEEFKKRQILGRDADWFTTLNEAVMYVQAHTLNYMHGIQERWLATHPALALYRQVQHEQDSCDPFRNILTMDVMRHGCPWVFCSKIALEQHKTLLWEPGQARVDLFLVHTGAVGLYTALPDAEGKILSTPVAIYRHGWFLNTEALGRSRTKYYAVALENGEAISWDESQWFRMAHEQPAMAAAISKAVLNQQRCESEQTEKQAEKVVGEGSWSSDSVKNTQQPGVLDDTNELITEEVQNLFASLHTAVILENYGLFNAPSTSNSLHEFASNSDQRPGVLPNLPRRFLKDLEIAFDTFSAASSKISKYSMYMSRSDEFNTKSEKDPLTICDIDCEFADAVANERNVTSHDMLERDVISDDVLRREDLPKALKYAGIASAMLDLGEEGGDFTFSDFVILARCALMARLSSQQMASIQEVFKRFDADGSGELDVSELETVLKATFNPFMSMEELVSIRAFWDEDRSGMIDIGEFSELVARLVRQCEQEWSVLTALRELAGDAKAGLNTSLTAKHLCQNSRAPVTEEEAMEMLWAADWRNGGAGNGAYLELRDVPAVLLLHTENKIGSLPPPPEQNHSPNPKQKVKYLKSKMICGTPSCIGQDVPSEVAQLVMDLRERQTRDRILEQVQSPDSPQKTASIFSLDAPGSPILEAEASELAEGKAEQTTQVTRCQSRTRGVDDFLNDPESSRGAAVWSVLAIATCCLSIVVLFLEHLVTGLSDEIWFAIEVYITVFFTLELGLRILVTQQSYQSFLADSRNICDLVAVMPFYLELTFGEIGRWWELLRINRVVRMFRLIRVISFVQVRGLSSAAGASVTILAVIWGIYLKYKDDSAK